MNLREIMEFDFEILEAKRGKNGDTFSIRAPWIVGGRKNRNGRLYNIPLLKREVKRVQKSISQHSLIGSADHPQGAHTGISDASHIITKLEIDKSGKGWMEAKILPTTKGKNAMEIIKNGGTLGISARGAGTVSKDGTVESDYRLLGIDLCTDPSEPEAVFNMDNVYESQNFEEEENIEEDIKKEAELRTEKEAAINDILWESFNRAEQQGFDGDFAFYKKLHAPGLREIMGLEPDSAVEKKLTEEQKREKIFSAYSESTRAGFKGDFSEWKEKYPNIVEFVLGENNE